jgi:hypothetical protein
VDLILADVLEDGLHLVFAMTEFADVLAPALVDLVEDLVAPMVLLLTYSLIIVVKDPNVLKNLVKLKSAAILAKEIVANLSAPKDPAANLSAPKDPAANPSVMMIVVKMKLEFAEILASHANLANLANLASPKRKNVAILANHAILAFTNSMWIAVVVFAMIVKIVKIFCFNLKQNILKFIHPPI